MIPSFQVVLTALCSLIFLVVGDTWRRQTAIWKKIGKLDEKINEHNEKLIHLGGKMDVMEERCQLLHAKRGIHA